MRERSQSKYGLLWAGLLAFGLVASSFILLRPYGPDNKEAIAVQHWNDYGLLKMRAAFVIKPGPLSEAELADPPRFRGHLLLNAIPYHIFQKVTDSRSLGLLLSGAMIVALLGLSVAALSRADIKERSFLILAIFTSPALLREALSLDPVPGSLLLALPALLWVFAAFNRSDASARSLLPPIIAAALAMTLNWTNAIALAVWSPLLLWSVWSAEKRTLRFAGFLLVGIVSAAVFGWLVWDKLQGTSAEHVAGYLAGSGAAYGKDLPLAAVFKRLFMACIVGLAPLWLLLAANLLEWRSAYRTKAFFFAVLPVVLAMALVALVLRNYASHAQWAVAAPIVLQGLVATCSALLVNRPIAAWNAERPSPKTVLLLRNRFVSSLLVLCIVCYGLAFTVLFSAFGATTQKTLRYVLANTKPHDVLIVSPVDKSLGRLSEDGYLMDMSHQLLRECVAAETKRASDALASERVCFLLTTQLDLAKVALPRQAESNQLSKLLQPFFNWYQKRVSGRSQDGLRNPENQWLLIPKSPQP